MDYEKAYKEALERARKIKKGEGDWRYSDLIEIGPALTEIFPELRESEDQRNIDTIFNCLYQCCDTGFISGTQRDNALAWLEKQKINTEGDFGRGYDCGYQAGYTVAMNEMKPKVATATLDSEKQKEPKTELVQQPTITYTYNSNASRDARLKAALLALLNSDLLKVKEGGYFTKQDLIEWVERIPTDKPAWSEEDEKIVNNIASVLGQYIDYKTEAGTVSAYATPRYSKEIAFLKSLPDKFILQPKQEWSKEDESFLDSIEDAISSYYDLNHAPQYHYWLEEKLKSLRPSWKPTEEQMKALNWARCLIYETYTDKHIATEPYHILGELYDQLNQLKDGTDRKD